MLLFGNLYICDENIFYKNVYDHKFFKKQKTTNCEAILLSKIGPQAPSALSWIFQRVVLPKSFLSFLSSILQEFQPKDLASWCFEHGATAGTLFSDFLFKSCS